MAIYNKSNEKHIIQIVGPFHIFINDGLGCIIFVESKGNDFNDFKYTFQYKCMFLQWGCINKFEYIIFMV